MMIMTIMMMTTMVDTPPITATINAWSSDPSSVLRVPFCRIAGVDSGMLSYNKI
jgi:hypothetical protein